MKKSLLSVSVFLVSAAASALAQQADTIYTGGRIFTSDDQMPLAEAVAIKDRKFIAVGSSEEVAKHHGPDTKLVDLDGGFVMPGIVDPHMHPFEDFHREAYLFGIKDNSTPEAMLAEIKAYADANPDKEWISGGSWPPGVFPDDAPTREMLDEVIPDRPVFILDQSAHSAWLNTKALELAGFMDTEDADLPEGSVVVRGPLGLPLGTIREFAIGYARRSMPSVPQEEWMGTGRGFQEWFHSLGVTSVKAAAGNQGHIDAVHALHEAGEWKLRMHMAMSYNYFDAASTLDEQIEAIQTADEYVLEFFDPRGFKIFMDGTPTSREGWFIEPYPGTDSYGVHYYSPADLLALYSLATEMNRVVMAHGTGDRSVRETLNAIESAKKAFPDSNIRHHPTHNGLINEDDIARFAELGLTIELSPIVWFPASTVKTFEDIMGRMNVAAYTNPRRLLDAGASIAVASDWSVGPVDPWARIGFLVSRVRPDDPESGPFLPESAVTAAEAIKASTLGPAHVLGVEDETGSIEVGKYADMIILDRDITRVDPTEIKDTKVLKTIFAGEEVFATE